MKSRNLRRRTGLRLELLEGRNAPSRGGALSAAAETLHHHATGQEHAGRVTDVSMLPNGGQGHGTAHGHEHGHHNALGHVHRNRHNDLAGHNLNDPKGQKPGLDDPAGHDLNDPKGQNPGLDDPAGHDLNDRNEVPGQDDPAGHDLNDPKDAQEDPAGHDANDNHGGSSGTGGDGSGHH
jgi:hypothetical protein